MQTISLSKRYLLIDKNIVSAGTLYPFDIYKLVGKDKISLVVEKNNAIDEIEENRIFRERALYIYKEHSASYQRYYKKYKSLFTLSTKSKRIYANASKVMDELFTDPDDFYDVNKISNIVSNFLGTINHKEFDVDTFIKIVEHDYYTHTHSLNVCLYALCLGNYLSFDEKRLENLGIAAILHDIGKGKISSTIINKKGELTPDEYEEVKLHPSHSYDLAFNMGIRDKDILEGIRNHHEKMDGSGYPDALKDDEINIFAKIIAVCDIFDALTTKKSYKAALSTFESFLLMKKEMNKELDFNIVNKFILMLKEERGEV